VAAGRAAGVAARDGIPFRTAEVGVHRVARVVRRTAAEVAAPHGKVVVVARVAGMADRRQAEQHGGDRDQDERILRGTSESHDILLAGVCMEMPLPPHPPGVRKDLPSVQSCLNTRRSGSHATRSAIEAHSGVDSALYDDCGSRTS
jgi:hypothetical protein